MFITVVVIPNEEKKIKTYFLEDMVKTTQQDYLYCCTVHLVDSLNITLPTNALIVCHLF